VTLHAVPACVGRDLRNPREVCQDYRSTDPVDALPTPDVQLNSDY